MRATEGAFVEEKVQGEQHLVLVVASGLFQMAELNQPVDFRRTEVEGDAAKARAPPLTRCTHSDGTGGDAGLCNGLR